MKIVIMIVLFAFCVIIGYLFSLKYKRRKDFFSGLIVLAEKLDVEINFSRERLKILIENTPAKAQKSLLGVDKAFLKYLEEGGELTEQKLFNKTPLKQDEKDTILTFFKSLGRSDVENQTKELKSYISRFQKLYDDAKNEDKKYGKLGTKLGIIAGLGAVVLLI